MEGGSAQLQQSYNPHSATLHAPAEFDSGFLCFFEVKQKHLCFQCFVIFTTPPAPLSVRFQNHSLEEGLAAVLEQTISDMFSCSMEVLQAYLHFEALQSHECPSLLITDLYQKGILNMAGVHFCMRGDVFTVLYLQQKGF